MFGSTAALWQRLHDEVESSPVRSSPASAASSASHQHRLTPQQFRRPTHKPQDSPASSVEPSDSEGDANGQYDDMDELFSGGSSDLDRSEDLNDEELKQLLATASVLTGLNSPIKQSQTAQTQPSQSHTADSSDEGEYSTLSAATLQSKIASERAVLGDLISKLTALQTQASQLKQMSDLSKAAQYEMQSMMSAGDERIAAMEEEKRQLELELQQARANGNIDEDEDEEDEQGSDYADESEPADSADASPSPSDSEIEVEIEHSIDPNYSSRPADSDDEITNDTRQLEHLEQLMARLGEAAEAQRRAAGLSMSAEDREKAEEEAEEDERLFFAEQRSSKLANGRKKSQRGDRAYQMDHDEKQRRARARRAADSASPSPMSSATASPSPPRSRDRSKQFTNYRNAAAAQAYENPSASSPSSNGTLAVPASRVPQVPISRWIGPLALPHAAPEGGSGRHAVYADRPATAVGTTRGAVRSHVNQQSQSHPTSQPVYPSSPSWQAPTFSSLPTARQNKSASVSSRSSTFVNVSDSEATSDRSFIQSNNRSRYGQDYESSIAEEDINDSDGISSAYHGPSRSSVSESFQPSDSDSDLPYSINHSVAAAAASSRPKSARQPAAAHLNGRSTANQRNTAPNGAQTARAATRSSATDAVMSAKSINPPVLSTSQTAASPLSSADMFSVLSHIGTQLYRSTIRVGETGRAKQGAAQLGGGRLGFVESNSKPQTAWQ